MRRLTLFYLTLMGFLIFSAVPTQLVQAEPAGQTLPPPLETYRFVNSWGGDGRQILAPVDMAIGPNGMAYIVNTSFHRVTVLDTNGHIYSEFGRLGSRDGEFYFPVSIAIAEDGRVYVADAWNARIQIFDTDGRHLNTFSVFSHDLAQTPIAIAIDPQNRLAVLYSIYFEGATERELGLRFFNLDGGPLFDFAMPSSSAHTIDHAGDISFDAQGNLYLANSNAYANSTIKAQLHPPILKVSADFAGVQAFYMTGQTDFSDPYSAEGIAVDATGNIWFTARSGKVNVISSTGSMIMTFGAYGTGNGQFILPRGLMLDSDSRLWVADTSNNRLQIFSSAGTHLTNIGSSSPLHGFLNYPRGLRAYSDTVIVSDRYFGRIKFFSPDGSYQNTILLEDPDLTNPYSDADPSDVLRDASGNVYVLSQSQRMLFKYDSNGTLLTSTSLPGNQAFAPNNIQLDSSGNLRFIDALSRDVLTYGQNLIEINRWPIIGGTDWSDLEVYRKLSYDLYLDPADNHYIISAGVIYKFAPNGSYLEAIDLRETEGGILRVPSSLTFDSASNLYVSYTGGVLFKKFSPQLELLAEFGSREEGFYWEKSTPIFHIAVAPNGNFYATNYSVHSVMIFAPQSTTATDPTALLENGSFTNSLTPLRSNSYRAAAPNGLSGWTVGGDKPVLRANLGSNYGLQLGAADGVNTAGISEAWAYQTIAIPPYLTDLKLRLIYKTISHDIQSNSDFLIAVYDSEGMQHLQTLLQTGAATAAPGLDSGWQSLDVNFNAYRGQTVRLFFSAREIYPDSKGLTAILQGISLTGKYALNLPLLRR